MSAHSISIADRKEEREGECAGGATVVEQNKTQSTNLAEEVSQWWQRTTRREWRPSGVTMAHSRA